MKVRSATAEDLPFAATAAADTFIEDPLFVWLHPRRHEHPEHFRQMFLRGLRMGLHTPGTQLIVAETDENDPSWAGTPEIAGYARWERFGTSNAARSWQNDSLLSRLERVLLTVTDKYHEYLGLDQSQNLQNVRHFRTRDHDKTGIPEYWYLGALGVAPRFHRHGAGSKLVRYGQQLAIQENLPVCLTASPMGETFYPRKLGFKIFTQADLSGFGSAPVMIWEPPGLEGKWSNQASTHKT